MGNGKRVAGRRSMQRTYGRRQCVELEETKEIKSGENKGMCEIDPDLKRQIRVLVRRVKDSFCLYPNGKHLKSFKI